MRAGLRLAALRRRLDALYRHYDHRFVDPDPLQFVRAHDDPADREVVGLVAAALAYGTVKQIKRSIGAALSVLGPRPARALRRLDARRAGEALSSFKHRFNDGRDVACLFFFMRQMLEGSGSVEGFFLAGAAEPPGGLGAQPRSGVSPQGPRAGIHFRREPPEAEHVGPALASFSARALALDHGGLYGRGPLPAGAGVRFFFPSPVDGSACKRLNLYLRWMVRREGVDLGLWRGVDPATLVIPLDAHIITLGRRLKLTRYRSPGWRMALDITSSLRRLDPRDPVKYDFALHRMGLWKKEGQVRRLEGLIRAPARAPARGERRVRTGGGPSR